MKYLILVILFLGCGSNITLAPGEIFDKEILPDSTQSNIYAPEEFPKA